TVPAGELETLLLDLRWQPAGWLAPGEAYADLRGPVENVSPVLVTEGISEPQGVPPGRGGPAPPAAPANGQETLLKISADLRALAAQEGAAKAQRMEVILNFRPDSLDRTWRRALTSSAPGLVIEGEVGPLVTVVASPKQAPGLAELPMVSVVR